MIFCGKLLYLFLFSLSNYIDCVKINILSNDAAFIKYQQYSNDEEIIFKEPLNDKLKLSVSLGNLQTTKELERSKYKSVVFVDKQRLFMQSNLDRDNFIVNSICKFDHEQSTAYTFERVCCQTTLLYRNKSLDQKLCKLEVSATASVCFMQLDVAKKHFDFVNKDEYELTLITRVFSSVDSKCKSESLTNSYLAQGLPQKIVVSQGLQVKWTVTDLSTQFGELEIGVPVDSIEVNSKTIFPLKIRSLRAFSRINLECSYGSDLTISTISFEGTTFTGEFVPQKNGNAVKIILQKVDGSTLSNWISVNGEHLVNLEMKVASKSVFTSGNKKDSNQWIGCRTINAMLSNSKLANKRMDGDATMNQVQIKVNDEEFVIIPIVMDRTYFSILNEINGPIQLQKSDLQLYSVHSIVDGSLVDVTDRTTCSPISNTSIHCPSLQVIDHKSTALKDPNWNILLSMTNWQRLMTYPIELWHAEDWRTVITDKMLNQITNWRYYDDTSRTCRPVYQVTRCQLIARIVKETADMEKVYFGQNNAEDFPLFDLTSHLNSSYIHLTRPIFQTTMHNKHILFTPTSPGLTDLSIVNDNGQTLVFDRLEVSDSLVSVTDLQVTCIHRLNVTQYMNLFNPSFRSIMVRSQPSRMKKENCYIQINVVFSDESVINLQYFPTSTYKVVFQSLDESVIIADLDNFIYQPDQYKRPGEFTINMYEPETCSSNSLIFAKDVDLYGSNIKKTDQLKKIVTKTGPSTIISLLNKKNGIVTVTPKFPSATKDSKGIDMDSLFLSMKILIGLVGLVVLIVILNCVIKIKQGKSVRLLGHSSPYPPNDKMTASTYSPADVTSQNSNPQHPPLLPPPGPLYNASDSSQLDLTVNATPDIFWGLPHTGGTLGKKNHFTLPMSQINSYQNMNHLQTRKLSPSPRSDSLDYVYSLGNKLPTNLQHAYNYPPDSINDTDSVVTGSSGKNCSQIMMNVPPPCPPLRWNNNVCSNQFAMYYPCATDVSIEPSQHSQENTSQNSIPQSHSSSWEIKQKQVLPPIGFSNSSDNVCEKSSGLGSLTSTKPESDCSKKDSVGYTSSPKTANYSLLH